MEVFVGIEELYLRQTANGLRSHNDEPLDVFVKSAIQVVSGQCRLDPSTADHATLVNNILQVIESQAASISCTSCSCLAPVVCCGEEADDEIVDRGGVCILPIATMFKTALSSTIQCYQKFSSLFASSNVPTVTFSTSYEQKKPHDIPVPYYVGGTTHYDDSTNASSRVCLSVCAGEFRWETYLAIMYVLFHECICHVFQGTVPWLGQIRPTTNQNDAFAEGWMDRVASWLLSIEASRPAPGFEFPSLQQNIGSKFHLARIDYDTTRPSIFAIARVVGDRAADKLLFLLERLPESKSDPMTFFLRLSLDLNLSSMDSRIRDRFAWKIDQCLPERIAGGMPCKTSIMRYLEDDPKQIAGLCELLRSYLGSSDLAPLVHGVITL